MDTNDGFWFSGDTVTLFFIILERRKLKEVTCTMQPKNTQSGKPHTPSKVRTFCISICFSDNKKNSTKPNIFLLYLLIFGFLV